MKKFNLRKVLAMALSATLMLSSMSLAAVAEDSIFVEDTLATEDTLSLEEFTEETGIEFNIYKGAEAEAIAAALPAPCATQKTLTFSSTKPSSSATKYDLSSYFANGSYTAAITSNTYSRQLLYSPNLEHVYLGVNPTDSSSKPLTVHLSVSAVSPSGGISSTVITTTVTDEYMLIQSSDVSDYKITMYVNLANANTVTRRGTINVSAS